MISSVSMSLSEQLCSLVHREARQEGKGEETLRPEWSPLDMEKIFAGYLKHQNQRRQTAKQVHCLHADMEPWQP